MFTCYNEITHTCDGRCQGASDCPMVHDMNINKEEMKLYIEDAIERKKEWDKFTEELHQDEEFIKEVKSIMDKFNYGRRADK